MEAIDRSLNQDIARRICGPEELGWVEEDATARHQRLLQLFSAKEAVYKAFYPLEEVFLGFLDVTLLWKADHFRGLLHKRVAADFPAGSEFTARAVCRHGMVLSAVQLPPAGY